jgi:hypothetical protein
MLSHLKNLLILAVLLFSANCLRSDDLVPSGSILYNGSFQQSGIANFEFSGSWVNQKPQVTDDGVITLSPMAGKNYLPNSNCLMLTPKIELPALGMGWSKTLYLTFEEAYDIEAGRDFGSIYIFVDGKKILLDTRTGKVDWKQSSYDVTDFAGKTVQFGFEFKSDGQNNRTGWKVKGPKLLSELELKGEIPYVEARLNPDRKSLYVYLDVQLSGMCPKIDSFNEDNFEIFDGTVQVQPYMFYNPQEKNNITPADIVFVIDLTSSMEGKLEQIKTQLISLVDLLDGSFVDSRIGIVLFGDNTYTYNFRNLTSDEPKIMDAINELAVNIHGITEDNDSTDNAFGALSIASGMTFRENARKMFILLTDNPAHENSQTVSPPNMNLDYIKTLMNKREIAIYPFFDFYDQNQKDQYLPFVTDLFYKGKAQDIESGIGLLPSTIINDLTNTYRIVFKSKNIENTQIPRKVQVKIHYNSLTK